MSNGYDFIGKKVDRICLNVNRLQLGSGMSKVYTELLLGITLQLGHLGRAPHSTQRARMYFVTQMRLEIWGGPSSRHLMEWEIHLESWQGPLTVHCHTHLM